MSGSRLAFRSADVQRAPRNCANPMSFPFITAQPDVDRSLPSHACRKREGRGGRRNGIQEVGRISTDKSANVDLSKLFGCVRGIITTC
jgi:hypothetical protein